MTFYAFITNLEKKIYQRYIKTSYISVCSKTLFRLYNKKCKKHIYTNSVKNFKRAIKNKTKAITIKQSNEIPYI